MIHNMHINGDCLQTAQFGIHINSSFRICSQNEFSVTFRMQEIFVDFSGLFLNPGVSDTLVPEPHTTMSVLH